MGKRRRRSIWVTVILMVLALTFSLQSLEPADIVPIAPLVNESATDAGVEGLKVKGRAPKTGYERAQFGSGWDDSVGCDTRNRILRRDLEAIRVDTDCVVLGGVLDDPYTGTRIVFTRGASTSDKVQIDHIVSLSNAWQTGAQQLTFERRVLFANDPLNLLAVDGAANQQKSDGDAATWLPSNKPFRCQYVKRQMDVKRKYSLWVTPAERDAVQRVIAGC